MSLTCVITSADKSHCFDTVQFQLAMTYPLGLTFSLSYNLVIHLKKKKMFTTLHQDFPDGCTVTEMQNDEFRLVDQYQAV